MAAGRSPYANTDRTRSMRLKLRLPSESGGFMASNRQGAHAIAARTGHPEVPRGIAHGRLPQPLRQHSPHAL